MSKEATPNSSSAGWSLTSATAALVTFGDRLITTVHTNTWTNKGFSLPSGLARKLPSTTSCADREARCPNNRNRAVESVVIPNPPNWINAKNATRSKRGEVVRSVADREAGPHTALVAVNRASRKPIRPPEADTGRASRIPPSRMAAAKPPASKRVGCLLSCCHQYFTGTSHGKPRIIRAERHWVAFCPKGHAAGRAQPDGIHRPAGQSLEKLREQDKGLLSRGLVSSF